MAVINTDIVKPDMDKLIQYLIFILLCLLLEAALYFIGPLLEILLTVRNLATTRLLTLIRVLLDC